jgi:hypothetical protein
MSINRRVLIRFAQYALVAVMPLMAQDRPTVTLENRSGDDALVRVVGTSSAR